jgi:uncharacterized protein YciI
LRRGPKWSATPTPEEQKLQEAHRAHIGAMAESGKLRVAGPFLDDSDLAGIFIFTCPIEEARAFAAEDPKVRYGWLTLEIRPWMCADGVLPQVTIPK